MLNRMSPSDAALVQAWIQVWSHARSVPVHDIDGWPQVHLASVTRETEVICLDPGVEACPALFHRIAGDPRSMLTIIGRDLGAYRELDLPSSVRLDRHDESLMTAQFALAAVPPLEHEFTFRWDVEDNRLTYVVEAGDRVAAQGTVGVLGDIATFDAVETTPAFQRRGLGRHVMITLTEQAMGRGARQGILAASDEGRQLYTSLGWTRELEMLSYLGA